MECKLPVLLSAAEDLAAERFPKRAEKEGAKQKPIVELGARELSARGHDVVTSVHRFVGNGRALIVGEPDGIVKLVAQRDGPLLGVHIVGPWATELIAEGYLAVNWEATPEDIGAYERLLGGTQR